VYDARGNPTFMVDQDSLKHIHELPLYNDAKTDLPSCKYIATVGYTVGSWTARTNSEDATLRTCASLNIQFVIVLGKVDKKVLD
jgi:hypothetical protein